MTVKSDCVFASNPTKTTVSMIAGLATITIFVFIIHISFAATLFGPGTEIENMCRQDEGMLR